MTRFLWYWESNPGHYSCPAIVLPLSYTPALTRRLTSPLTKGSGLCLVTRPRDAWPGGLFALLGREMTAWLLRWTVRSFAPPRTLRPLHQLHFPKSRVTRDAALDQNSHLMLWCSSEMGLRWVGVASMTPSLLAAYSRTLWPHASLPGRG